MKRVFNFLKQNGKTILKGLLISFATIAAYDLLHVLATAERGYEAYGGELFALLIPFFIAVVVPVFKEPFKRKDNN